MAVWPNLPGLHISIAKGKTMPYQDPTINFFQGFTNRYSQLLAQQHSMDFEREKMARDDARFKEQIESQRLTLAETKRHNEIERGYKKEEMEHQRLMRPLAIRSTTADVIGKETEVEAAIEDRPAEKRIVESKAAIAESDVENIPLTQRKLKADTQMAEETEAFLPSKNRITEEEHSEFMEKSKLERDLLEKKVNTFGHPESETAIKAKRYTRAQEHWLSLNPDKTDVDFDRTSMARMLLVDETKQIPPDLEPAVRVEYQKDVKQYTDTANSLARLKNQAKPEYLSAVHQLGAKGFNFFERWTAGAINKVLPKGTGAAAADVLAFSQQVNQVFHVFRKAVTGAAASFSEIKWLKDSMPTTQDSKTVFDKKVELAEDYYRIRAQMMQTALDSGNVGQAMLDVKSYDDAALDELISRARRGNYGNAYKFSQLDHDWGQVGKTELDHDMTTWKPSRLNEALQSKDESYSRQAYDTMVSLGYL